MPAYRKLKIIDGIVSFPVDLHTLTTDRVRPSGVTSSPTTGSKVSQVYRDDATGETFSKAETVTRYGGESVELPDGVERRDTVEVESYVPASSLSPEAVDATYSLTPQRGHEPAFSTLYSALLSEGRVLVGRAALDGKAEVLVAVAPQDGGLRFHRLRPVQSFKPVPVVDMVEADPHSVELMAALVTAKSADAVEPIRDTFADALAALVPTAEAATDVVAEGEALMDALRASVAKSTSKRKAKSRKVAA